MATREKTITVHVCDVCDKEVSTGLRRCVGCSREWCYECGETFTVKVIRTVARPPTPGFYLEATPKPEYGWSGDFCRECVATVDQRLQAAGLRAFADFGPRPV